MNLTFRLICIRSEAASWMRDATFSRQEKTSSCLHLNSYDSIPQVANNKVGIWLSELSGASMMLLKGSNNQNKTMDLACPG